MNTHIKEASVGKRFLAYFLDMAMVLVMAGLTYGLVTSKFMFEGLHGDAARQKAYHFAADSSLVKPEDSSGNEITNLTADDTISMVAYYSFSEAKSSTQSEPGYSLYFDKVWHYYTEFLNIAKNPDERVVGMSNSTTVSGQTTTTPFSVDDYYTYLEVALMKLPAVSTITDVRQESQLQQTKSSDTDPVYFKYDLNDAKTAVDIHKKPVLVASYQTLVDASDATACASLQKYMYNASGTTGSGLYYNAFLDMQGSSKGSGQTFYADNYSQYNMVLWECLLVAFMPFHLIFMLIIPLCMKNGETLGKLICKLGVASKEGWALPIRGRILHPLCLALLGSFVILPWSTIGVMVYVLVALVDYMVLVMSKTHMSIHDKIAATSVYSKKESLIFKNEEDMKAYAMEHPEEFPELKNSAQDAENTRIAQEDSILDLSTMNKNREEAAKMAKFDDYEKAKEEETKNKGGSGSGLRPKVNLTKTEGEGSPAPVPGDDNPENKEAIEDEQEATEEEKKALADLAVLEGAIPEEDEKQDQPNGKKLSKEKKMLSPKKEAKIKSPAKTPLKSKKSKK